MAIFHQMGNDSSNLVFDLNLSAYKGSILSPVNATPDETLNHVVKVRERLKTSFEVVFDPQFYSPKSRRGCLPNWDYFPKDVDTADLSSVSWWKATTDRLVASAVKVKPSAICSPAMVPRSFSDAYYDHTVSVCDHLDELLQGTRIRSMLTAIVEMKDLATPKRAASIASILSRASADEVYLVLMGTREPRREYQDEEELKGAMKLIQKLEAADMRVLVSFCSTDLVLWKFAGATSVATGKFFNLRRFTLARFDEPKDGGGQIPYWMEESLLGFVRQTDLIRLQQRGLLSDASRRNPFTWDITDAYTRNKAWLAYSWKQYLWWFGDIESRLVNGSASVPELLQIADKNWAELEQSPRLFMEERQNDGAWIRSWLRAVEEIPAFE